MYGWRRGAGWSLAVAAAACAAAPACSAGAPGGEATATARAPLDVVSKGGCTIALTRFDLEQLDGSPRDYIELEVTGAGPAATLSACGLAKLEVTDTDSSPACQKSSVDVGGTVIPPDGFVLVCDPSARSRCDAAMPSADWMRPGEILDFVGPDGQTVLSAAFGKLTSCGFVVGAPGTTEIGEDEHAGYPDRVAVWCYQTWPDKTKSWMWTFKDEADVHVATPPGQCPVAPPSDGGPASAGASAGGASAGAGGSSAGAGGANNGMGGSSAGTGGSPASGNSNSSGGCAVDAPGSSTGGGPAALAALVLAMAFWRRRKRA